MGYLDIFGNNKVSISDSLFNNKNVKYVSIFHKTDAAFTHKPETEGEITFVLNDMQGAKKFNGENIMEVLAQMTEFLKSLEQSIMTLQDRNLYTKYHFHQGEYGEYTTEYKGYCIEIAFDEVYNRYEADAFDLIAEEYVFYPCTKITNTTLEYVIEVVIARIDNKIILNDRDKDILIPELPKEQEIKL